ncbi:hypothetical protein INT47_002895 [Mucor saturninus]|uniref:Rhodanese domain-containing protein n=1 Tax=Mucor saturninus TaxID=64648 RepID=A0A8H7QNB0_9FUNG|nr:hypothetical protein INT47_002895 [Mucor saturninus]
MKLLRAWIESSNSLCVDLRTKLDFKQCHLKSSTNIPLSQLVLRQSELPPKRLPFAVIEPLHEKGCATWLIEQGWQVPWVLWEGELTWKQAIANGWISDTDEQWLLFQPSPFLMAHMDTIELPLRRRLKKDTPWTCLDIGCGSGRDVGWLLARNKQWHASAFDSLAGAMVRTDLLVRNLNVGRQLDLLAQAKLLNNGEWKLVSDAWWDPHEETQELQDPTEEIAKRLAMTALESKDTASYTFPQFYNRLRPTAPHTFDLILNIRFLSRPFLEQVPSLLNKGGCFVISHFVDDPTYDYKQPKKSLRLQMNEISQFFAKFDDLEIVKDVIEEIEDGRPINSVIVRKKE